MEKDKRILEEMKNLHCDPHPFFRVFPSETDFSQLDAPTYLFPGISRRLDYFIYDKSAFCFCLNVFRFLEDSHAGSS